MARRTRTRTRIDEEEKKKRQQQAAPAYAAMNTRPPASAGTSSAGALPSPGQLPRGAALSEAMGAVEQQKQREEEERRRREATASSSSAASSAAPSYAAANGALPSPTQLPRSSYYEDRAEGEEQKRVGALLDSLAWKSQSAAAPAARPQVAAPQSSALGSNTTAMAAAAQRTADHKARMAAMSLEDQLGYLLNPANKLSLDDERTAKQLAKQLTEEMSRYAATTPDVAGSDRLQALMDQKALITALENRTSPLQAGAFGLAEAFENLSQLAANPILNKAEKEDATGTVQAMRQGADTARQTAQQYHPLAHGAGRLAGEAVKYMGTSGILDSAGVGVSAFGGIGKAGSEAISKIPVLGGTAARFFTPDAVAGITRDLLLDVGLDTIPNVVVPGVQSLGEDYTAANLAGDVAGNLAANTAFNVLGEAANQGIAALGKRLAGSGTADVPPRSALDNRLDEILRETTDPGARANRLEDAARQASDVPRLWDSAIDAAPSGHTAAQNQVIAEYMNAADPRLASYVDDVLQGGTAYRKPFELGSVNTRQADDLAQIVGFDTSGYRQVLDPDSVRHIDSRHGATGKADHSMASLDDVARMQYVLDNYDNVSLSLNKKGEPRLTKTVANSDGTLAPTVIYEKAINGTYYIVEAVPDNKNKALHIVSAYIGKNNGGGQVPMLPEARAFDPYAQSGLASAAADGGQMPMLPANRAFGRDAQSGVASTTLDASPDFQAASSTNRIPQLGENGNGRGLYTPLGLEVPEAELGWAAQRRRALAGQDVRSGGNLDDLPGPGGLPAAEGPKLPDDAALRAEEFTGLIAPEDTAKRGLGVGGVLDPEGVPGYSPEGFRARAQDNMQTKAQRAYQQFISGQAPLERLAKSQDPAKATLNDYAQQVRNAGGTVDYIAERGLVGRSGQPLGPGWKEFTDMPALDSKMLNEYMLNQHNIARRARDMPVLDLTGAESAGIARDIAKARPDLAEKAAEFQKYNDAFTKEWAVNGNLVSPEQYDLWRKIYPDYVPTFRRSAVDAADAAKGGTSAGGRHIGTPQPLKGAVGSVEDIVPLEDAFMMQVNSVVRAERKNEVLLNLYELAKNNPEAVKGKVEILPANASNEALHYLQRLNPEEFVGQLDDMILESLGGSRYRATAFVSGRPVQMEVSADIYNSLKHLFGSYYDPTMQMIMDAGHKVTATPKALITGYNPNFAARNLIRDVSTGYTNTISDKKTLVGYLGELGGAAKEMAQGSDDFKLFLANGGSRSGFYNTEKGFVRSAQPKRGLGKAVDAVKGGFEFLGNNSETLSRFAEFRRGLNQYGRDASGVAKAMQASADVTVNFARNGPMTKVADSWVMYLNAAVQGLDKTARTIKANPGRTLRRTAEAVAVPAAALWLLNKDNPHYQDLNNRTKDAYFLIPNLADRDEDGQAKTFIKLPKNREYGALMGATLERALRVFDGEDAVSAFEGLGSAYMDNYGLSNPVTENILAPLLINLPQNEDWAGRTIVPYSMQDLEPRYQYDYTSSAPAKWLGNALNQSPKQIDYLFDQYGGFVADVVQPMTNQANKSVPEILASPWTQAFVADPLYSSNVTDRFYNELDSANTAAKTQNFVGDIPATLQTPEEIYARQLSAAQREMNELRQQEHLLNQADIAPAQRVEQTEALREAQVEIARAAAQDAQVYTDTYRGHYDGALDSLHQSGLFQGLDETQSETAYKAISTFADEMADQALNGGEIGKWTERAIVDAAAKGQDVNKVAADYAVLKALNGGSSDMKIVEAYNVGISPQTYLAYKDSVDPGESGQVGKNQSALTMMQMGLSGDQLYNFYTIQNPNDSKAEKARAAGIDAQSYFSYSIVGENYARELGKESLNLTESAMLTLAVAEAQGMSDRQLLDMFALNNSEKTVEKIQTAQEWGVAPKAYLTYMTRADYNGNGSVTQQEAIDALNSLPLSQQDKAKIFYLQNSSWKARPFGYW